MTEPRLRMFAGPNGSGKSTLKDELKPEWLGVYVNPDDMEKAIKQNGLLDFSDYSLKISEEDIQSFLGSSEFLAGEGLLKNIKTLKFSNNKLYFGEQAVNSYHASVLSDFIRRKLLNAKVSFSFETVMSHINKVNFLDEAQQAGFRTYLYYVATEDADINVERVQIRVASGGHSVPEDKIRSRYKRSLALLFKAVEYSNRAYIFDNSDQEYDLVAEVTEGERIEMKTERMPHWFKTALWDKFV
jgi:predicted ABC-type ATPase